MAEAARSEAHVLAIPQLPPTAAEAVFGGVISRNGLLQLSVKTETSQDIYTKKSGLEVHLSFNLPNFELKHWFSGRINSDQCCWWLFIICAVMFLLWCQKTDLTPLWWVQRQCRDVFRQKTCNTLLCDGPVGVCGSVDVSRTFWRLLHKCC